MRLAEGEASRGEVPHGGIRADVQRRGRGGRSTTTCGSGRRIGVAAVAAERYHLTKVMHEVERFVERWAEVEIIDSDLTLHSPDD